MDKIKDRDRDADRDTDTDRDTDKDAANDASKDAAESTVRAEQAKCTITEEIRTPKLCCWRNEDSYAPGTRISND